MAVTTRFVIRANPQKILCVLVPNLALMTWRKVLAPGALIFSWTDTIENSSIWIEAPAAYQNGPLIPYWKRSTNGKNLLQDVTVIRKQSFSINVYYLSSIKKNNFLPFPYCCKMYIDHLKSLISNPNKKKETTQEWNPLFALKLFEMIFVLIFDDIYVSVQVHYY